MLVSLTCRRAEPLGLTPRAFGDLSFDTELQNPKQILES